MTLKHSYSDYSLLTLYKFVLQFQSFAFMDFVILIFVIL